MKAKLFQKDNEPYFWTINQLSCLQNDDKHKKLNGIYCLSDIEIEVTNENLNNNPIFIDDGINIILFENTMLFENFVSTFKSNYKF